jgi:hypothetical protein
VCHAQRSPSSLQAFECDRRLQAAGWRPIRVTWRHLHREREELSRDIAAMLAGC